MSEIETPGTTSGEGQDGASRRLLIILVGLLGIAAVALLVLLVSLLWPKDEGGETSSAEGYPVIPVRSILGYGSGPGERLTTPLAATFDGDGNVWVSDTGNGRVLAFDQNGALIATLGEESGPGDLSAPYGLTVDDATNRVYVADFAGGRVVAYDKGSGVYAATFPNEDTSIKEFQATFGKEAPFAPYDVKIVGERVAAATPNGLWFFDNDGKAVGHWGTKTRGTSPGTYNFPDAFTVDEATNTVYVADTLNRRVVALDGEGKVKWESGSQDTAGAITGFWQLPRGIAVGPECNVYVVDTFRASDPGVGEGYFVVLGPDGKLLSAFGRQGVEDDAFNLPDHLDYHPDGDLWVVADRENNRVLLFRLGPLPAPDARNVELFPQSFSAGPFETIGKPFQALPTDAPPGPCPTATAPGSPFPWWILVVLAVVALTWWAVRRIRKNRQEREAAALAAATGVEAGSPPAETPDEAPSVPEETPPDGS